MSGKNYKPLPSNMSWRNIRMGETRTKEEYLDKFR